MDADRLDLEIRVTERLVAFYEAEQAKKHSWVYEAPLERAEKKLEDLRNERLEREARDLPE